MEENALVVGVARNCGETITEEYNRLKNALTRFKTVHFYIVESDSSDNTIDQLKSLKESNSNFEYISLGSLKSQIPKRTDRISYCRNQYLKELKDNDRYKDIQYVIIADLDGVNNLISKQAINSCWQLEDWDVCTSNQKGLYYDIYALRHPLLNPVDWHKIYMYYTRELGIGSIEAKNMALYSKMFQIAPSTKPILVQSAFGGFAIYKKEALLDTKYIGLDEHGNEICEHVTLHKQITDKGFKIYINPKLINCESPVEHTELFNKKMLIKHLIEQFAPFLLKLSSKK